ncbi:MAG: hypothetical protein EA358_09550 [Flavobacteriales bacterium]|nr:MAG: hypothetical protein EA358_09550 [Flavobacteriales bacterium]
MMLKPFDLKTVTLIAKQYPTNGHSPFLVLTEDFERYVLKPPLNSIDKTAIVREFICNQLLSIWQIKTPQAASLCLSDDLLTSDFVKRNKSLQQNSTFFGSLYEPNSIDLQIFFGASSKVSQRKIANIADLLDIALFDIWVENEDRKPTNNNIILKPVNRSFQVLPIDNALTFSSMSFESLNPDYVSFSDNDSILYSPLGLSAIRLAKKNRNWVQLAQERFYLCILDTERNFQQICDYLPTNYSLSSQEAASLKSFLFNPKRNKKVFEQFKYIVSTAK